MDYTVFLTVFAGVITYVVGQLLLKLVIEPVHDLRKTIGTISYALIEHAAVIHNPGVPTLEAMDETSQELRSLSSKLHAHLYLVPAYKTTACIFLLPSRKNILEASSALIGLSNSVYQARDNIYTVNAKRIEKICDSLGIFLPEDRRLPAP